MLSPGQYHQFVPRDLRGNYEYRKVIADRARGDRAFQRGIIELCQTDILFFINTFIWQYDPTQPAERRIGPFITWPCQERLLTDTPETTGRKGLLWCVENQQPMVWEKSREMGATWLMLIAEVYLSGFHSHYQALNISKSADAVDGKSKNSLFKKIRFIHEYLPAWLLGKIVDTKMYFEYQRMNSEITGEASTARAGVGGRAGFVGVDEAAEIEELPQVRAKLASTAPFRLFISTHLAGNPFEDITADSSFVKAQLHWVQHPDKNRGLYSYDTSKEPYKLHFWKYDDAADNIVEIPAPVDRILENYDYDRTGKPTGGPFPGIRSPWYDKKAKEIKNDQDIAIQLDINPDGSVSQFYLPLVIRSLKQKTLPPFWQGDLEYDKETATPLKLVRKAGGKVKLWCNLNDGKPPRATYGAGADISQGTGSTPSCLSIANRSTGEKVFEYVDANMFPSEFAVFSVAVCKLFADRDGHGAMLAWEAQGPGAPFGKMVWDRLGYQNVYVPEQEYQFDKKRARAPGFNARAKDILQLHLDYRGALEVGEYKNYSYQALDETLRFKHDGRGSVVHVQFAVADPSAARENHGDIVVADALSYKMIKGGLEEAVEAPKEDTFDIKTPQGRRNWNARKEREEQEVWR